jgi:pimeloyl-ACP methyl ester carboxylesterase
VAAYAILRRPRHETRQVRGLAIHLHRWGPEPCLAEPAVLLLHGWQDTGETFQFMVDAFARDWPLVALDWRGFGRSEWPQEGYWFPDYLADLDALLDQLSPQAPVRLVGHSMGGNIGCLYAGLRPERVRCIANLEGFGLPRTAPQSAPAQLRKWLEQARARPVLKTYDSVDQLASVIRFRYPRFSEAQAAFVAEAWSEPRDGRVQLRGDSRHRWINPVRYQREDAEACWREIRAPVLLLVGEESEFLPKLGADGTDEAFRRCIPQLEIVRIAGAGHMLHIEKAHAAAALVERFLGEHDAAGAAP